MGILRQASSPVANSSKISISMWFKFRGPLDIPPLYDGGPFYVPLLEFGTFSGSNSYSNSGVYLTMTEYAPGPFGFYAALGGVPNSVDYVSCLSGNWDFNSLSPWTRAFDYTYNIGAPNDPQHGSVGQGFWHSRTQFGSSWTPYCSVNSGSELAGANLGDWCYLFFSLDTSIPTVPIIGSPGSLASGPACTLMINAHDYGPFDDIFTQLQASLSVLEVIGVPPFGTPYEVFAAASLLGGNYVEAVNTDGGPGPPGATPNPFPGGPVTFTIPGFEMDLVGRKIGLPGASFYANPKVQMAFVQIWVGQFIDGPGNFDKFVNLSGGHGTPQPMSVAAANFGRPTFAFTGNKAAFPFNLGTGGAFTQIGTINDADPGPSF